jgi:hypothetical protein
MGNKGFLLAAGVHWLGLPMGGGDFDGLVVWIELDGKVGQVQFFRDQECARG